MIWIVHITAMPTMQPLVARLVLIFTTLLTLVSWSAVRNPRDPTSVRGWSRRTDVSLLVPDRDRKVSRITTIPSGLTSRVCT